MDEYDEENAPDLLAAAERIARAAEGMRSATVGAAARVLAEPSLMTPAVVRLLKQAAGHFAASAAALELSAARIEQTGGDES
jgi:hypothetical protein